MFTYASALNISYTQNMTAGMTCNDFYTLYAGFPQDKATALCTDTSNTFNFNSSLPNGIF